jgi:uridine kinase
MPRLCLIINEDDVCGNQPYNSSWFCSGGSTGLGDADCTKTPSEVKLVVGIAGPSGAGKSALAEAVARLLDDEAMVLPYDSYYRDLSALSPSDRERVDFDCLDALEAELLISHLDALRNGRTINVPCYDFSRHCRTSSGWMAVPRRVVLVEGLFVLADERICEVLDLRVYVDAPVQTRLGRRIARDTTERGYAETHVKEVWSRQILPAEATLVVPSARRADLVVVNDAALEQQANAVWRAIDGKLRARWPRR